MPLPLDPLRKHFAGTRFVIVLLLILFVFCNRLAAEDAQPSAWFVDGYHGGVYGHYPSDYTGFLVEQLRKNPKWKINLEIEPETWDVVRTREPAAYAAFKAIMDSPSDSGRVEIVNPGFAQSYLFQASGESMIRQFDYGIRKLREHFPKFSPITYSSEEPCFTSALPQVLRSFGFKFASLKNPDTCWGGYTTARGGELLNWIGPDGTSIPAVPRYANESLLTNSSWQTIAFRNSPEYLAACAAQGIQRPVGMCLQDAGWRNGPWMGSNDKRGADVNYTTWNNYFSNVTFPGTNDDWHFTAEDVKPGLMWGSQILQQLAQRSRRAEHRLLVAEKLAAMAWVDVGRSSRAAPFDEAWHGVLLSQHHDCWIVPYNGRLGNTWADQVERWTTIANGVSELSVETSLEAMLQGERGAGRQTVRLFNPTGSAVDAVVPVPIPKTAEPSRKVSVDAEGRKYRTQVVASKNPGQNSLLVRAKVPPMGWTTVELREDGEVTNASVMAFTTNGVAIMESDLYRIEFDLAHGGTIRSLIAKSMANREFVDSQQERRFNELRGHFYEQGGFHSTAESPATVTISENGPLRAVVEIRGMLAGSPFMQRVSIAQGSSVIDCSVRIDWQGSPRIGEFEEKDGFKNRRRPAYDDRFKLLAQFPVRLTGQKIVKNAPYDVCESKLDNTFYNSWEGIKNNIILDWVDVTSESEEAGMALFSDHTTSYAHGSNFPLGLTIQYAGKGLWGRDYRIEGPTEVHYALMPHAGRWDAVHVSSAAANWMEPVTGTLSHGGQASSRTLIETGSSGWEVPAMFEREGNLYVRLFNSSGDETPHDLGIGFEAKKIELVELDGRLKEEIKPVMGTGGKSTIRLSMPRFGIRTLRIGK